MAHGIVWVYRLRAVCVCVGNDHEPPAALGSMPEPGMADEGKMVRCAGHP
jgi:hypothetical protein